MSVFGRSEVRQRLLGEFFAHPGLEMHVRDAARRISGAPSHVGRELERLEAERVLESRFVGRSRVDEVSDNPVALSVRGLFNVTLGIEAQLAEAVRDVRGVDEAFVFGSRAQGSERTGSDVDLLVVGDRIDRQTLFGRLADIERRIGREIEVVQVKSSDWAANESPWIRDVRSKRLVSVRASGRSGGPSEGGVKPARALPARGPLTSRFPGRAADWGERPYFLWDVDMSWAEFKAALRAEDPPRRRWALSRLLRSARWDDIWRLVAVEEVAREVAHLDVPRKATWQEFIRIATAAG